MRECYWNLWDRDTDISSLCCDIYL